jgi:hypothetical protein
MAPPLWIKDLVDAVDECITVDGPTVPLEFHHGQQDRCWLVAVYPGRMKLVGALPEGEEDPRGFTLDLEQLRSWFDQVQDVIWRSQGSKPGEGPYVAIEGVYQGKNVFLEVLAYAPR